jgi:hypothetical protein
MLTTQRNNKYKLDNMIHPIPLQLSIDCNSHWVGSAECHNVHLVGVCQSICSQQHLKLAAHQLPTPHMQPLLLPHSIKHNVAELRVYYVGRGQTKLGLQQRQVLRA